MVVDPRDSSHLYFIEPVNRSAFVSKLNSTGSALSWSTYLGGLSSTSAYGLATNGQGEVFVTGSTVARVFR